MNCNQGDLAVVVRATITPGLVDRVVQVIRPAVVGEIFLSTCGARVQLVCEKNFCWVVRSATPLPWLLTADPRRGEVLYFSERVIKDACLRPISGVLLTDDVAEELHA